MTISGVPYIDIGTYNFTEGGYTPPTWSGSTYNFGEGLAGTLKQIWTDDDYVYAAVSQEFAIIEIESELKYAYSSIGCNTVWSNDDRVFIGTTSGIKWLYKTCISGSTDSPYDISNCLNDYNLQYGYSHHNILYLHGYSDEWFMFCTPNGVDVYRFEPQGYRSTTSITTAQKCFMTSTGAFYYTTSGTEWALHRMNSSTSDWTTPDVSYITGSGIFAEGIRLNDLFVTENTSQGGTDNVLFVATSSGVYVIDEEAQNYNLYYIE